MNTALSPTLPYADILFWDSVTSLPFPGRWHKMTYDDWLVVKQELSQIYLYMIHFPLIVFLSLLCTKKALWNLWAVQALISSQNQWILFVNKHTMPISDCITCSSGPSLLAYGIRAFFPCCASYVFIAFKGSLYRLYLIFPSGREIKGSYKDQPVTICLRKCNISLGGWEKYSYSIQRLKINKIVTR